MMEKILQIIKQFPFVFISFILCVLFFGSTSFFKSRLDGLESERVSLSEERVAIEYNLENGKSLDKDLEKLNSLNEIIKSRLWDPNEKSDGYQYFYSLEEKTGVKISNLSQISIDPIMLAKGTTKKDAMHTSITYRLDATGLFPNILNLLYNLQQSQFIPRIKKINLNRAQQNSEEGALIATIEICYFGLPEK